MATQNSLELAGRPIGQIETINHRNTNMGVMMVCQVFSKSIDSLFYSLISQSLMNCVLVCFLKQKIDNGGVFVAIGKNWMDPTRDAR